MIDWSTAPTWAKYVAMDETGDWMWYEQKPVHEYGTPWWVDTGGNREYVRLSNWKESLQERPQ
jgi:hypothetical protein